MLLTSGFLTKGLKYGLENGVGLALRDLNAQAMDQVTGRAPRQ